MRAAAVADLTQDAAHNQRSNLAGRGVLRNLADFRPLGRRQIAREPVQKTVQHSALVRVQILLRMGLPERRLVQDGLQPRLGRFNGTGIASNKPRNPSRDVEPPRWARSSAS